MSIFRAVVTLPYTTGLPRDVSVNVWHFHGETTDPREVDASQLAVAVERFYNEPTGAGGTSIVGAYYGTIVSRATDACTVEFFDLADAEPRTPFFTWPFTLPSATSAVPYPLETALCTSFQSDDDPLVPIRRRRGRVFIGPLNGGAANATTGLPRPRSELHLALVAATERLNDEAHAIGGEASETEYAIAVYSRVDDEAYRVTSGWVDDEWDTQRRREVDATARVSWP